MLLPQSALLTVGHKHSTPRSVGTTAAARDLMAFNVGLQGITVSVTSWGHERGGVLGGATDISEVS